MKTEKKTTSATNNVEKDQKMPVEKKTADTARKAKATVEDSAPTEEKKGPDTKEVKRIVANASEKKSTVRKPAATKKATTTKKAAATKLEEESFVEFSGEQISISDVIESAKAHYKALYENEKGVLKSIVVYVKPEEKVAYYVANGVGCDEYKVGI